MCGPRPDGAQDAERSGSGSPTKTVKTGGASMILKRLSPKVEDGQPVLGALCHKGRPFAVTLEPPYIPGAVEGDDACIPAGTDGTVYECARTNSPAHGETFEITGVLNRTHVLFHKGNVDADTLACVLVGEEYGALYGEEAVLRSGHGFGEFMDILKGKSRFSLMVVWV